MCPLSVTLSILILFCYFVYLVPVKVRRFNETRPPPDVQREDWMMSFVRDSFPGGEVGYRYFGHAFFTVCVFVVL